MWNFPHDSMRFHDIPLVQEFCENAFIGFINFQEQGHYYSPSLLSRRSKLKSGLLQLVSPPLRLKEHATIGSEFSTDSPAGFDRIQLKWQASSPEDSTGQASVVKSGRISIPSRSASLFPDRVSLRRRRKKGINSNDKSLVKVLFGVKD